MGEKLTLTEAAQRPSWESAVDAVIAATTAGRSHEVIRVIPRWRHGVLPLELHINPRLKDLGMKYLRFAVLGNGDVVVGDSRFFLHRDCAHLPWGPTMINGNLIPRDGKWFWYCLQHADAGVNGQEADALKALSRLTTWQDFVGEHVILTAPSIVDPAPALPSRPVPRQRMVFAGPEHRDFNGPAWSLPAAHLATAGRVVGRAVRLLPGQTAAPGDIVIAKDGNIHYDEAATVAAAIIIDRGGATCHLAVVARGRDVPCLRVEGAWASIPHGALVVVDPQLNELRWFDPAEYWE